MDKLYDLYLKDGIKSDAFRERNVPFELRRKQIDETLPRLEAELDIFRINLQSKDVIISQARDLYGRWNKLPFEDKRRIVETILDRIVIAKDDIDIMLHFVPHIRSELAENSGKKATHDHGFIAAMSWNRAG
jgi:site-specific DNA recombinase